MAARLAHAQMGLGPGLRLAALHQHSVPRLLLLLTVLLRHALDISVVRCATTLATSATRKQAAPVLAPLPIGLGLQ